MRTSHIAIMLALCVSQASLTSSQVCAEFQVGGVKAVLLRARDAERAQVIVGSSDSSLKVCGVPSGGAKGYHPADPNWRETPPSEWGLAFKSQRYGDILVVSSFNEIAHVHHLYYFEKLEIIAPRGVTIELLNRTLSEKGSADLSEPKAF
jgi:hypothetical protein